MSVVESGFVPLTYAEQNGSNHVGFRFDLPDFVQKDEIGVNLRRIDRACEIGGIKGLVMHGRSGMETSVEEIDIVGITGGGEALAGKTNVRSAPVMGGELFSGPVHLPSQMRFIHGHVDLNVDEITSKIRSQKEGSDGVRSSSAWASEIDRSTREAINTLGQMQLLVLLDPVEKFAPIALDVDATLQSGHASVVDVIAGTFDPRPPDALSLTNSALIILGFNQVMNLVTLARNREISKQIGYRHSLFFGAQFDRAIILKAYTKLRTFVKEIKAKS